MAFLHSRPASYIVRLVMDLINRPQRTQLLKIAARKGIATVPGVEMLIAQGIAQWKFWMHKRAPRSAHAPSRPSRPARRRDLPHPLAAEDN